MKFENATVKFPDSVPERFPGDKRFVLYEVSGEMRGGRVSLPRGVITKMCGELNPGLLYVLELNDGRTFPMTFWGIDQGIEFKLCSEAN